MASVPPVICSHWISVTPSCYAEMSGNITEKARPRAVRSVDERLTTSTRVTENSSSERPTNGTWLAESSGSDRPTNGTRLAGSSGSERPTNGTRLAENSGYERCKLDIWRCLSGIMESGVKYIEKPQGLMGWVLRNLRIWIRSKHTQYSRASEIVFLNQFRIILFYFKKCLFLQLN